MASSRRSAKDADPAAAGASRDPVVDAVARACADARTVLVAFSGGLDSTVLLHAAVRALGASRVVAAHVHHGLQPAADDWPAHCARVAAAIGARFESVRLDAGPPRGDNVEAWARAARYGALAALASSAGASATLTAHHADDQVETLLMRIARGTGPDGLAGILREATIAGARVLRPLLALRRDELEAHAARHALEWVEDPTNSDTARSRNSIRHRVLPLLDAELPGMREGLLALAQRIGEPLEAVAALARIDLDAVRADRITPDAPPAVSGSIDSGPDGSEVADSSAAPPVLDRARLAALPAARRDAALRAWIAGLGLAPPTAARHAEMVRQLVDGRGAHGRVLHEGWVLHRDGGRVAAHRASRVFDPAWTPRPTELQWRGEPELVLPEFGGWLEFVRDASGVAGDWLRGQRLCVAPGASSARLRPSAAGRSRTLKNLHQERGVPAWARGGLPAVWVDGRLLFAAGAGMDRSLRPDGGERISLRWRAPADDPRAVYCRPDPV